MLNKVEAKCKRCKKEFCKKRTEQEFCSAQCRNAAWKRPRKRRLKGTPWGSVANSPFSSIKTEACKPPHTPDLGAFVRAQIVAHQDEPLPINFALPYGTKGRVWLASDNAGSKIISDDRLWRIIVEELLRKKERRFKTTPWTPTANALRRPIIVVGRNDPVKDVDDALRTVNVRAAASAGAGRCMAGSASTSSGFANIPVNSSSICGTLAKVVAVPPIPRCISGRSVGFGQHSFSQDGAKVERVTIPRHIRAHGRATASINFDLPALRSSGDRSYANGRLPGLLRL
jgi:hypothetical protein